MTTSHARTDRLRIAIWHHLPSGGGKRALFDHVRGLVERGHEVEAWCPSTAERQFLPIGSLVREHVIPLELAPAGRMVEWWSKQARTDITPFRRVKAMSAHALQFSSAIRGGAYDVLLAIFRPRSDAPFAARHVQIPKVLYLQEPCRWLYEAMPALPWIAEEPVTAPEWSPRALRHFIASAIRVHPLRVQAREELRSVRAFDRVLVNSRFSRESLLRAYGIDSSVCYLGVDTARFRNNPGERRPTVMSVGEFHFHKNPEFVIRAVALSETKPVFRWIANRAHPPCLEAMTRLSRELGVTLELMVGVSDEELVRHYQEGTALLYAPRLEPFGFAPLEANACGMAVIAVAEGGVRETVVSNENGQLVDSPSEMAATIDRFIRNPEVARTLGQRGATIVRDRWTLQAATQRLEEHLQQVVSDRRPTSNTEPR